MTEEGWLAGTDPRPLFGFLRTARGESRKPGGRRRLRLFACACLRGIWSLLRHPGSRQALYYGERFADGLATDSDLATATLAARSALATENIGDSPYWQAAEAALHVVAKRFDGGDHPSVAHASFGAANSWAMHHLSSTPAGSRPSIDEARERRHAVHAGWLRDIFGNPFRPVTLGSDHRTPAVASVARAASDERHMPSGELDLQRLAVLSDALEEAGAPDEILDHLRSPGPHVRGCWAVDLCLGLT